MRLLPRMRPHVPSQGAGRLEQFASRLTDMRYARRLSIFNVRFSAITTKAFIIGIYIVLWHGINTLPRVGQFVPL